MREHNEVVNRIDFIRQGDEVQEELAPVDLLTLPQGDGSLLRLPKLRADQHQATRGGFAAGGRAAGTG